MAFEVPALPYAYDALAPHIDEATMRLHHHKHHQAYVDKANAALVGTDWADAPVEEVLANLATLPADKQAAIRNNAGGHHNHSLFWDSMSPVGGGGPEGELADALVDAFGTIGGFRERFEANGVGQFGSGWTWLVVRNGALELRATPNQDSPLLIGATPLLGNDVWEHAYYLTYQNRRPEYLKAWWNVVDWETVAGRYAEARNAATVG
jgi:Fe-Mn family superoxide dismutase